MLSSIGKKVSYFTWYVIASSKNVTALLSVTNHLDLLPGPIRNGRDYILNSRAALG